MNELEEDRTDAELLCLRLDRYVLIVDDACFSRLRSEKCEWYIHDRDLVRVKLVHCLCDMLEDRWAEERGNSP